MTIKEFASLCGCNTQTLRYYDKIDLLKPVKTDQWRCRSSRIVSLLTATGSRKY